MRTLQTLAFGHVADAATVCICGTFIVATKRKSPKQPFDSANLAETETVNSPQLDPTTQTRTNPPFALAAIAVAAMARGRGVVFAALQALSSDRSFAAAVLARPETALSLRLARTIEERTLPTLGFANSLTPHSLARAARLS
ncbi:hypothetical protein M3P21_09260 [Ruegeria sp. 2012CJ41-6]|uniref:Uncharacterized protein n=1 Tax=Ruegeria spongiae TaxID=2942209 RepID=A0ABT0Q1N6_9RHOB|nr:hypothetical protein [Ruegeria spongiae]MCL6283717.1 hypothetical protein [Ruegeria spongiae]